MKRLLLAIQFLTILPLKIKLKIKDEDYGRSLLYFPLAGLLIGILLSTLTKIPFLPNLVTGAFILILSAIITGGIHLDGFADTCDGFYGSQPKEEILRIMRDSLIGAMGIIGLVGLLLLKFTLIVNIEGDVLWKALIVLAVFSRWSQSLACISSKYARHSGKAKLFIKYAQKEDVIRGALFTLILFLLLAGLKGILIFILALIIVFIFINYIKKKIDGMTGDTIGATNEVAEVALLLLWQIIR